MFRHSRFCPARLKPFDLSAKNKHQGSHVTPVTGMLLPEGGWIEVTGRLKTDRNHQGPTPAPPLPR